MGPSLPGSTTSELGILITSESDPVGIDATTESLGTLGAAADEAATQVAAANDEVTASNQAVVDSYREVGVAAEESSAAQDTSTAGTDVAKGALGSAGLAGAISSPYVMAGAAVAGAFTLMIKSAADFQQQLVQLYNTAGETLPLKQLESGIISIANATTESTTQLTQGLYHISSAGYSGAGGLTVLKAAAEAAYEENANLTDVSNALVTIMHDYHQSASQATATTNAMLTAVAGGNVTLQDFASSLSTVLPKAYEAGLSFNQIAAAEATLTRGGVSAQQSTQDLAAVIMSLVAPTQVQVKAMQQMGLDSVSLSKNLGKEGLTGTLDELVTAVAKHAQDGQIIQSSFQNATLATQDLNKEIQASPPALQQLEQEFMSGTMNMTAFRKAVPTNLMGMASEFENTYKAAHSFNQQLVSAVNNSPTVSAELKTLTGQTNSLNAILMLTGANQATFDALSKKIADSSKTAGSNVQGWAKEQNTMNFQMKDFVTQIRTTGDELGNLLLPAVTEMFKGLNSGLKILVDVAHALGDVYSWLDKMASKAGVVGDIFKALSPGNLGKEFLSFIPGFASGVTNFGGGLAMVGEEGPELVYLPSGSSVIPSNGSSSVVNSGSPYSTNNNSTTTTTVTIGQVVLSTAAAVSQFITEIDMGQLVTSKGLTASRGIT